MNKTRWKTMDNVFIVSLLLMVFFAYMDVKQITSFFLINSKEAWVLYGEHTGPAIWAMWYAMFIVIGLIWYLIFKDKSEAVALTASLSILQYFGSQDLFYFLFSSQSLADVGCWYMRMPTVKFISQLCSTCTTGNSLLLSGMLGMVLAYFVYKKLQKLN